MSARSFLPGLRTLAFATSAALVTVAAGLLCWGTPPPQALGTPGRSTERPVTATDVGAQQMSSSPALASDPTDARFVVIAHRASRSPRSGCGLEVSGNGGNSWVSADTLPELPQEIQTCTSPDVAFDGRGALYFLFTGLGGPGQTSVGVYLSTSNDRAHTFTAPRRVAGPLAYGARIAVDRNATGGAHIYVAWLQLAVISPSPGFQSEKSRIMATQSRDSGATFSDAVPVSASTQIRVAGPTIALSSTGLAVAYFDVRDEGRDYEGHPEPTGKGSWSLTLVSIADLTRPVAPGHVVDDTIVPPMQFQSLLEVAPAALALTPERTCVAWTDARFGDPDILLRCKSTHGWNPVHRVNDDRPGTGYWQYEPQLAIAPSGRIDICFYDRRNSLRNRSTSVFFAYSYDGNHFSANVQVNALPFDGTLAQGRADGKTGPAELGDRLALAPGATNSLLAWTDMRNSAPPLVAQDIYAMRTTLLFPSERPHWAIPVGLGGLLVGAAGLWLFRRRRILET